MIDQGECDYKVLAIATSDPLANQIHSSTDVDRLMPGLIPELIRWLRLYKRPDGKPANKVPVETSLSVEDALAVVEDAHEYWMKLVANPRGEISTANITITESPSHVTEADADKLVIPVPRSYTSAVQIKPPAHTNVFHYFSE